MHISLLRCDGAFDNLAHSMMKKQKDILNRVYMEHGAGKRGHFLE
jgi:hypothetical protein